MSRTRTGGIAPVRLPPFETHRLANGLRVVVAPRRELPLASVELLVEVGAADDPPGRPGLAAFTAGLLRRGTEARNADQIDGAIEFVGGHLDTGAGADASTVSAGVTSENLSLALEIVADVALRPSFPKAEFQQHKRRVQAFLAQALDDPATVASRSMLGALLPEGHPYAAPSGGTRAAIASLRPAEVRRFHRTRYAPERSILFVVGDVEPGRVLSLARRHFGGWRTEAPPATEIPEVAPPAKNRLLVVHKDEATQVQVRFVAHSFPGKNDPAYFPAMVANGAFGGGFTSRLVDAIRVERGLSYSAGTRFLQLRRAGFFTFQSFTRNETVGELLRVALDEAAKAREAGFRPEEITRTRRYLAGLYPLRLETNDQIAAALAELYLYDLPRDWVERYRERLGEVTPAQVAEAARTWFFARPFAAVLVGDEKAIRRGIRQAKVPGDVQVVAIEDMP